MTSPSRRRAPWWLALLLLAAASLAGTLATLTMPLQPVPPGSVTWWTVVAVGHLPFLGIVIFLVGGFIERLGFLVAARRPETAGRMPSTLPRVCVQLPMFDETVVAARAIRAVCALDWPRHLLHVQVLDDSADSDARQAVDDAVAAARGRGIQCDLLRRESRDGYKAGALEAGRRHTDAEFIAIFDADFLPAPSFLQRTVPSFYSAESRPLADVALVQARWGHLNRDESPLTRAQSLWVDDHHTLQMTWRSRVWGFVNFTGTAGVWRASSIERAGGWRAASLVEDCELSFRHLFAGYRTRFAPDVLAPAELPATLSAYRSQQRRWTQGWAQLQRLHTLTLLTRHRTGLLRRLHLLYHLEISSQWLLWGVWMLLLPILIHRGLWLGALHPGLGLAVYAAPVLLWLVTSTVLATIHTARLDQKGRGALRQGMWRLVPYAVLNAGMLPHQVAAYLEGLFGPMHTPFVRTPKTASTGEHIAAGVPHQSAFAIRWSRRVAWPTVFAEIYFAGYITLWTAVLFSIGLWWCALSGAAVLACVVLQIARTLPPNTRRSHNRNSARGARGSSLRAERDASCRTDASRSDPVPVRS